MNQHPHTSMRIENNRGQFLTSHKKNNISIPIHDSLNFVCARGKSNHELNGEIDVCILMNNAQETV
jgi:hypothetical protein